MDRREALDIARRYKHALGARYGAAAVYLYGSYSKGTQRTDSDIDVAVVIDEMQGDWFANVPQLWTTGRKVHELIEPVLIERRHPSPLLREVLQSGIEV